MRTGLLLLFILATITSCRDNQRVHIEKKCYPDGKLQVVATLRGNKLHGLTTWYYPSGKVDNDSHWIEGKRTGITRTYYTNGVLKDSADFLNDSLNGDSFSYYANGALKKVAHYRNGKSVGAEVVFNPSGKRTIQFIHDQQGKLVYHIYYDENGVADGGGPNAIVEAADTIPWGKRYTGSMRFAYPLRGKVTMIIGVLGKNLKSTDPWPVIDTIQVVPQSKDGRFYFSYNPKQLGKNTFQYKFIQSGDGLSTVQNPDTLWVNDMNTSHSFFAKKIR